MEEFCTNSRVRNTLKTISQSKLTGWEKWLQIEFLMFLQKHPEICDPKNEQLYYLDGRKSDQKKAYADFSFRKKFSEKSSRVVLEFKANNRLSTCIDGMINDWIKICCVRQSEDNMRSFWVVGFHRIENKEIGQIEKIIKKLVEERSKWKIGQNLIKTIPVSNSGYAVTLF